MWLRPLRPAGPGMSWKETQALLNGRGRGGGSGVSCSGKLLAYWQLFSLVSLSAGGRPWLGLALRDTGIFLAAHPLHLLGGLGDHSQRSPSV